MEGVASLQSRVAAPRDFTATSASCVSCGGEGGGLCRLDDR